MRYVIKKIGTHTLPLEKINQDVPDPGECVLGIGEMLDAPCPPWSCVALSRKVAADTIRAARKQGWRFAKA